MNKLESLQERCADMSNELRIQYEFEPLQEKVGMF